MPIAGSDRKWEGGKKEEVASIAAADNSWPLDSSSGSVGSSSSSRPAAAWRHCDLGKDSSGKL